MSLRNRLVLPIIFSALALLAGCGSSTNNAIAPPGGGFTNSNLSGTYVFSTSGTDVNGAPIAITGSFTANGTGGISGGTIDANDPEISPISLQPISGGGYSVTKDGRGRATLNNGTALGTVTLDFALTSNDHGLIMEFDGTGTGSGTLDLQSGAASQSGLNSYAFDMSGTDASGSPLLTVGAFSLGGGTTLGSAVQDFNDDGFAYKSQALTGNVTLGSNGTTGTAQLASTFGTLNFDFYVIDATHLKFIEIDDTTQGEAPLLSGDAYTQSSASIPSGSYAFTLAGVNANGQVAAGGLITSDGEGNISGGSEDANNAGTSTSSPISFSGTFSFAGPRAAISLPDFFPGSTFAAYPSTGGLLMLEVDSSGALIGSALSQTSTTLADTQGYALNLTGVNLSASVEVDDIAEFTAASASSSPNMTGLIDENEQPIGANGTTYGSALSGTYATDGAGRGTILVPSANILNGGFGLTFYPVDGSNFIFIENDGTGQIAVGSFEVQASTTSAAQARRTIPHFNLIPPKAAKKGAWKGTKSRVITKSK